MMYNVPSNPKEDSSESEWQAIYQYNSVKSMLKWTALPRHTRNTLKKMSCVGNEKSLQKNLVKPSSSITSKMYLLYLFQVIQSLSSKLEYKVSMRIWQGKRRTES